MRNVHTANKLESMLAEHGTRITMTFIFCHLLSWKLPRDLGHSDPGFQGPHSTFNHGCIKSLKESRFLRRPCFVQLVMGIRSDTASSQLSQRHGREAVHG